MNDLIRIVDHEVRCHIGVTEEERAVAQRLLITLELWLDTARAAAKDDLELTINYSAISRALPLFSSSRQWRLLETMAADLAAWVLSEFKPARVGVEIKKFVLPQAAFVSVRIVRPEV